MACPTPLPAPVTTAFFVMATVCGDGAAASSRHLFVCFKFRVDAFREHRYPSHMANLLERITVNPKQCGGRPCVRGMRIRVTDVLDLFAAGLETTQILDEMPDLEPDDIKACLTYARRRIDHPLLAA